MEWSVLFQMDKCQSYRNKGVGIVRSSARVFGYVLYYEVVIFSSTYQGFTFKYLQSICQLFHFESCESY